MNLDKVPYDLSDSRMIDLASAPQKRKRCVYVCASVCMCVHVGACVCMCVHVCACVCMCVDACVPVRNPIPTFGFHGLDTVCVCVYICMRAFEQHVRMVMLLVLFCLCTGD